MPWSRLRGSASSLVALTAVVTLLSAFCVGAIVFLEHQAAEGIRSALNNRAGADLALSASLAPTANPDLQNSEVRAAIDRSLASTGMEFAVTRTLSADLMIAVGESAVEPAVVMTVPDLDTRVDLVDGQLSDRATSVAVQADAAKALGLVVGSTVDIDGAEFTVDATWRARDYLDPRWSGDPLVAQGVTDAYGPFLIAESAWSRLNHETSITWTVVPRDLDQVTSINPPAVIRAWASIQSDWRGEVADLKSFGVQRGFSQTLAELNLRAEGQRAIEPVIFTLLGVLALVGLSEVIGLLVSLRSRESVLYWSRGMSQARIARRAARDVAVCSAIGASLGFGVAIVGAAVWVGADDLVVLLPRLIVGPLILVIAATVLAGIRSYRSTADATRQSRGGRAAARKVAVPGLVVLAAVGASVSVWQLRLYGSPITPSVDSVGAVDPVAVAAPAIALIALVLLVAALLPVAARRGEKLLGGRSTTTRLAARTLVQYTTRFTAALMVISLAVGTSVIAASYSSTWTMSYDEASQLRVGADVHVASRVDGISPAAQAAVQGAVGTGSVAPVEVQPLSLGSVSGTVVAVSPGALAALGTNAGGLFDPARAADTIRISPPGPVLPTGVTGVRVTLTETALVGVPAVSAFVADSFGTLTEVTFSSLTESVTETGQNTLEYEAELDATAVGDLTVLSLDLAFAPQSFDRTAKVRLVQMVAVVDATEVEVDLGPLWIPGSPGTQSADPGGDGTGFGMIIGDDTPFARLVPSLDGSEFDRVTGPVVISQRLADLLGLAVGDSISFSLQDGLQRLDFLINQIVPAIPGAASESAVLMDLALIQHFQLRTTAVPADPRDLWIQTNEPTQVREQIRSLLPANARVEFIDDESARQVLESPRLVLWAAAIVAAILALIAVGASLRARARWGKNDIAILRAVGLSARDQPRIPVIEFAAIVTGGLLWGAIAGIVTSALTVPELVRAAVPQRYFAIGTSLSVDPVGLTLVVVGLLVGLALLLVVLARRIRLLASRARPGESEE